MAQSPWCGRFAAAGSQGTGSPAAAAGYEQVYTRKIFTIPRYQQHIIDDYYTVQACMEAHPGTVHPRDFQIKRVRSLVDPDACVQSGSDAERPRRLDRLIDAMASRNKEPKLAESRRRENPALRRRLRLVRARAASARPSWL